jgi:mRNA-degrading endonuclease RelE of RelBE toxin-antitoxin system
MNLAVGRHAAAAILAMCAMLPGCGADGPSDAEVERFGAAFFAALQQKDFDRALTFYDDEFFRGRAREQWKAQLQDVQAKLGDLKSAELKRKQADIRYSGKFHIHEYRVTYANDVAWETVTLFVPNGSQAVHVFGHTMKAKGIQ